MASSSLPPTLKKTKKKRCVVVMYDTLCRHFMPTYGNEWIKAPNFSRLARHTTQCQNMYVGSMPCMPARRELHTGRYNFLHRSWGPLEPFDDSMPERLRTNGIHSHKCTDHHHYWEDGGATYHQRFTTFDLVRGQEGDKWIGDVAKLRDPAFGKGRWPEYQSLRPGMKQDNINREHMTRAELQPQHKTFSLGLEFIERNKDEDRWYLQIETFDPHEPFFTQQEFQDMYPHEYDGPPFDWPPYREVREDQQTVEHVRYMYAALVSFCDQQLGRVLDVFDKHNLWEDTMLIVNTDHGFLMGEHDWWAKVMTPFFQEIAHIPFWFYHPDHPDKVGGKSDALVQTIDIAPTVLDYFGLSPEGAAHGAPLSRLLVHSSPPSRAWRGAALYGVFGGQVNVTDGRYVYMRGPGPGNDANTPLFEYTLMPTHMNARFRPRELKNWEKHGGFSFTKECKVMQIPARTPGLFRRKDNPIGKGKMATLLFDVEKDPGQVAPLLDVEIEARMIRLMLVEMIRNDCPVEQYDRLGLPRPVVVTAGAGAGAGARLPAEAAIRAACVLASEAAKADAKHGGAGSPNMPFFSGADFPRNLRLRPGLKFSRTKGAPRPPPGAAKSRL